MQRINLGHKSLADYRSIIGTANAERILELAEPLRGRRMLHLSATAFGGGVAEIQYTLMPLLNDIGIDAEWRVIEGREEFFDVTKTIHNGLQGDPRGLTQEQREIFVRYNQMNADELADADEWDMIVVHDPQPAMIRGMVKTSRPKWVWRCHIDLSAPNPDVLGFLAPALSDYDAAIFHMHEYVPSEAHLHTAIIWPPAIDPLAPKNMALAREDAAYIVDQFGIDPARPLMLQVSRFDPWKDPSGVIDAYRIVKEQHPGVQLGAGRLDGARRSGGLGVLEPDPGVLPRRSRHPHVLEPQQRGCGRGQRVPGAGRGVHPEVDQGRLRIDRVGGAVEGPPDHRWRCGRYCYSNHKWRDRLSRVVGGGVRRAHARGTRRSGACTGTGPAG